jgi:hypothetical protein
MQLKRLFNLKILGKKNIFLSIRFFKIFWFLRIDFQIDQYPEEIVTRHEFDPIKRSWHISQITIKIESRPFAHGSMRECYRL